MNTDSALLTGVSDAHRARQKHSRRQQLQSTPSRKTENSVQDNGGYHVRQQRTVFKTTEDSVLDNRGNSG